MFRSVCLIGAVVLMASSALADTACGTAPIADAMVTPGSVSSKTAEEALKIKHEAYVSVTSYQAKLKIFRDCLNAQLNAQKTLLAEAKDEPAKKAPQAAIAGIVQALDKAYDDETEVVNEFVALQTAVCKIATCTPPKK